MFTIGVGIYLRIWVYILYSNAIIFRYSYCVQLMARRFGSLMHELSKEEQEKGKLALKDALNEFDSDNSGTLSYNEYMTAVKQVYTYTLLSHAYILILSTTTYMPSLFSLSSSLNLLSY